MSVMTAPPVLSTPETHILNDTSTTEGLRQTPKLSNEQLDLKYEIERTVNEIKKQKWQRIALQFPDSMLPDSARVYQSLARRLHPYSVKQAHTPRVPDRDAAVQDTSSDVFSDGLQNMTIQDEQLPVKLTILADTSYGSCCVDEIAAEHVDADAIVHYGRACLSPTARLPVVHIFTKNDLNHDEVFEAFINNYPHPDTRVIITADVPYADHVKPICSMLQKSGYMNVFAADIMHDPGSPIPNRSVPQNIRDNTELLQKWHMFHISEPPTSLLLTLTSRMAGIKVYLTKMDGVSSAENVINGSTPAILRRRYALITSLATVPVWGILINTLSVKNYLHMVEHVKSQIQAAGRKSYLFVVGKINAAKVANFSEIGGWIVIGCWESSLIDSKEFYKPIITPFELELALSPDSTRLWTGQWRADFDSVLEAARKREEMEPVSEQPESLDQDSYGSDFGSEEESEPPEFDLRTGRYVSRTRPVRKEKQRKALYVVDKPHTSMALAKRTNGDIISVRGVASPGAEFLAQKRSWKGLGSDFKIRYDDVEEEEGSLIEEGRTGIASSYIVGNSSKT